MTKGYLSLEAAPPLAFGGAIAFCACFGACADHRDDDPFDRFMSLAP